MRLTMLLLTLVGVLLLACIGVVLAQQTMPDPSQPSAEDPLAGEIPAESGLATGVLEKPGMTLYMYGTHTITDEVSGTLYALRSEDEGLLDGYVGQRVTVFGTPAPGYENGAVEGGPPLLNVTRIDPV